MTRLRPPCSPAAVPGGALARVGACGGDDDGGGGGRRPPSSTDVEQLLTETFTGSKEIKSGNVDLTITIEAQGGSRELEGPVNAHASTARSSRRTAARCPSSSSTRRSRAAARTSRPAPPRRATRASSPSRAPTTCSTTRSSSSSRPATRRRRSRARARRAQSFATLGIDPRKWLTDPQNEGEAKVGDDDTIKITGGVDVGQAARRRQRRARARPPRSALGAAGGEVPEKLTERSASRCSTRSRTRRSRSTRARTTRSCAGWSSNLGVRTPAAARAARSPSTSRSPTSTRTRTSPSRRTPSRSTSCSASSAASALGGAAARRQRAAAPRRGGASRRRLRRGPREVLRVPHRRRLGRRRGAQVRRPPDRLTTRCRRSPGGRARPR